MTTLIIAISFLAGMTTTHLIYLWNEVAKKRNKQSNEIVGASEGRVERFAQCPECAKSILIDYEVEICIEEGLIYADITPNTDAVWAHWEENHFKATKEKP